MNIDQLIALFELRKKLEKNFPGFPNLCCKFASSLVLSELGYEVVGDAFVLVPQETAREHFWNRTPSGLYVDLAGDQFNAHLPEQEKIPRVHVVPENSEKAKRFYCLEKDADVYVVNG